MPNECTYCGRGFYHSSNLKRHIRIHTGERTHRCEDCGKTFIRSSELTVHMRNHTGERPFECEVCGKRFSSKENLNVHKRIHTKEKPYRCSHCGCTFKHSGSLNRHLRTHTGERPHQCTVCGKNFIQSGELTVHMRTHLGGKLYVCMLCNKELGSNRQLKIHLRSHTGKQQLACDSCGKTFAHNHVLKLHMLVHLRKRLYKCNLCAETFSFKKALDQHIKSHGVLSIRQSTSSPQHTDLAVVLSSSLTATSLANSSDMNNGMGCSILERRNPSPQQSQGFFDKLRAVSNMLPYSSNSTRDPIGGIHRQKLLASLLFGSAFSINQANSGNAKEWLSSNHQKSQEQKQLIIINENSKVHHKDDPDSTYLLNIPPLIPISANCSNQIISNFSGSEHNEEQKQLPVHKKIMTNEKSKVNHQYDPDSTNFLHIPPLIPIRASYCSTIMIKNSIGSEKNKEQVVMSCPPEDFYKERQYFEA